MISFISVKATPNFVCGILSDGREISIPTSWFPRLANAKQSQLKKFVISPGGYGIHWPDIDEDISIKAFISGLNAVRFG